MVVYYQYISLSLSHTRTHTLTLALFGSGTFFIFIVFLSSFYECDFLAFGYWWRCKGIDRRRPFVSMCASHRWIERPNEIEANEWTNVCRAFVFALTCCVQIWLLITIENELCTRLFGFVTICRPPCSLVHCVRLLKYFNHHKNRWSDII